MAVKGAGLSARAFPARAYLIETRMGLVVWDTGYASHFREAAQGIYRLYSIVTPVHFDERESLCHQLRHAGIGPQDIRMIVLSHFHADHIAGLRDFPDSRIVCSKQAWESVKNCTGLEALRKAFLPKLLPQHIEQRLAFVEHSPLVQTPTALLPFTQAWDLTGDGELLIARLPGHAEGQLGAFVLTESGWQLLAADAAWAPEAYRELRGPSELSFLIQHNRRQYYQTLHALHALHRAGQVQIHLAHEPEDHLNDAST